MNLAPAPGLKPDNQKPVTQQPEPEDERGLGGHVAMLILYGILVTGISALSALTGRQLPGKMSTRDLLVTAVATHKLSRTLTKDAVTSPLRAPFTEHDDDGGPGEVMESPKHSKGFRGSLGELLTCPFCFDVWAITALTVGQVFAPRVTRVCVDALAALSGADFLHLAYAKAQQVAG
jgi:hypothetical protein